MSRTGRSRFFVAMALLLTGIAVVGPALHKRVMILASIALVVPALGRMTRFPVISEVGFVFALAALASLLVAVWAHDLFRDRRLHATTVWGSALVFGGLMASNAFARTEAGKAFVASISLPAGQAPPERAPRGLPP